MTSDSTKSGLDAIGRELKNDPPAVLAATRRKKGIAAAEKQREAIMFSKARKAGLKVPQAPKV